MRSCRHLPRCSWERSQCDVELWEEKSWLVFLLLHPMLCKPPRWWQAAGQCYCLFLPLPFTRAVQNVLTLAVLLLFAHGIATGTAGRAGGLLLAAWDCKGADVGHPKQGLFSTDCELISLVQRSHSIWELFICSSVFKFLCTLACRTVFWFLFFPSDYLCGKSIYE